MSQLKALAFFAVLFLSTFYTAMQPPAVHFQTEQEAKQHCSNDAVVWVNTKTGVYHLRGERWYGATKQGAYECRKEADAEGDRLTRNGSVSYSTSPLQACRASRFRAVRSLLAVSAVG